MALTLSKVAGASYTSGNKRFRVYDITFDSSYPTGGEAITAASVGLHKIEQVIPHGLATATVGGTTGIAVVFDHTNQKLQAFWGNAGTASVLPEVTDTTDIATQIVRVTFVGF